MEKLPTDEIFNEIEESSKRIERERIREKFLQIKYPLSEAGLVLKAKILDEQEVGEDELPTVENPRAELFEELSLGEEEKREIFERDLSNIQVTKGCRHKCTFCAAGAAGTVDSMPFPAIVKMAQEKKRADSELMEALNKWQEDIVRETGHSLDTIIKIKGICDENFQRIASGLTPEEEYNVENIIGELFNTHPFKQFLIKVYPEIVKEFNDSYKLINKANAICFHYIPIEIGSRNRYPNNLGRITNYYDSDPFDYKDRSFLHHDGSVADFGDVAELLASKVRPIHITTAGWSQTDKVAQRAAEKIVKMGPDFFNDIRLSVNQYEVRARKNLDVYISDTLNTIATLAPLGIEVLIFDDESDSAYTTACAQIKSFIKNGSGDSFKGRVSFFEKPIISKYSGNMKNEDADDHHDVMACMPGFHIWPDGTIAKQERKGDTSDKAPKGARPTPTGKKMWR